MIAAIRLPEVGNFMTLNIVDIEFFNEIDESIGSSGEEYEVLFSFDENKYL